MPILPVVYQILMLFLIAACGLLMRKMRVFTDGVIKGVNKLMLYVTWPMMAIMTTQKAYTSETLAGFLTVMIASTLFMAACIGAVHACCRRMGKDARSVLTMIAVMPNAGYIGLPIISAVYGDAAMLHLAGYIVGFNFALWTVGVAMFEGFSKKALRALLTNPGMVSAVVGVLLFVLRVTLPTPVLAAVTQLGNMNTPLAMLLLGARMDTLRPRALADGKLWAATLIKLLAQPLLALLIFGLLGVRGVTLGALVLLSAMPAAAAGQMLAEKYDADVGLAARGVSVTTLCSIATIPVVLLALNAFFA